VKIFVLSHPLGDRGNVHGSSMARWKARGRLPVGASLIEFFLLALMAAALLSEICPNRRFPTAWVTLSANFRQMGTSPAIHLWNT